MKKKILGIILAVCLFIPCAFCLTACGKDDGTDKTMNISVNPEVSFVVDDDNEIVSVIFENEDAGTIYANVNFEGMPAKDAVKILIERSVISGHFTLTGDTVALDVNGSNEEDINELKNIASEEITKVCSTLGIEVTIDATELNEAARKTALVASAMVLAPEKTQEELENMTSKQLVDLIKDKQEALQGLAYSQVEDIKQAFSSAENLILQAIQGLRDQIASAEDTIEEQEALIENLPENMRESAYSIINEQRNIIADIVEDINEQLENYETAKQQAIASAKAQYESIKTSLVNAYNDKVASAKAGLTAHLDSKLSEGKITQEQYNYWIQLTNQQQ